MSSLVIYILAIQLLATFPHYYLQDKNPASACCTYIFFNKQKLSTFDNQNCFIKNKMVSNQLNSTFEVANTFQGLSFLIKNGVKQRVAFEFLIRPNLIYF